VCCSFSSTWSHGQRFRSIHRYLRPIKFFERRYTTTRLKNDGDATMYRYKVGATADNLNSIFYMELQSRLREELASDVEGGVFGDVSAGDVFLLMCNQGTMHMISMLHIIDKGNGYVSFQLRGLELAGTFCQNREAEALDLENEWLDPALHSDVFQMCSAACSRTPLSKILPLKLMRDLRWKTWEREATNYSLKKGYVESHVPWFSSFHRVVKGLTDLAPAMCSPTHKNTSILS
jgi:hypothetical protein